ncbi:XRE family transcriptional regulator [Paenibacillus polymyxa]|nr:XRE family transcriptional regulator [Paenibacillus polymyxa]
MEPVILQTSKKIPMIYRDLFLHRRAIMSTIGQRIRTIRKNNLNQIKFANIIGISQATLSELEQDKYKSSLDVLIAIKENFNSYIEWLIFGDTPVSKNTIFIMRENLTYGLMRRGRIYLLFT